MATLLFFDDFYLNRWENLRRRIGQPELVPEATFSDPEFWLAAVAHGEVYDITSQRVEFRNVDPRLLQYAAQRTRSDLTVVRDYRCTSHTAFYLGELDVASL